MDDKCTFTAPFNTMPIVKSKSRSTVAFFPAAYQMFGSFQLLSIVILLYVLRSTIRSLTSGPQIRNIIALESRFPPCKSSSVATGDSPALDLSSNIAVAIQAVNFYRVNTSNKVV